MKNIRLFITSILVIVTVGSTLAFKVFNPRNIFCNDIAGACNNPVNFTDVNTGFGATTDPCGEGAGRNHHYSTISHTNSGCPVSIFVVFTPNAQ